MYTPAQMKAFITGASGFVGQWLTRRLLESGHSVRVLSRSGTIGISGPEVIKGDILNLPTVIQGCDKMDVVFHLAGVVGYSRAQRDEMERVNVGGTKTLIEASLQARVPRVVIVSSVTAIGASSTPKTLDEESPYTLSPWNLGYFETKRKAERLVMDAVQSQSLPAVVVNPSTIYGPGDATKGSRKTQLKVARGEMPFYTKGGVSVIGIEPLVEALIAASSRGRVGQRYILAGENISIQKLFELIAQAANVKAPSIALPNWLVHTLGRVGDQVEKLGKRGPFNSENARVATLYHWFDSAKAQNELGLRQVPAETCIESSVKWMKDQSLI